MTEAEEDNQVKLCQSDLTDTKEDDPNETVRATAFTLMVTFNLF